MSNSQVHKILENSYGAEIAQKILDAYKEIESNYVIKKWKPSELDAGHFVESARRIIEVELFGSHTPYTKNLPKFDDREINRYENAIGDDSFRMLLPRALKAVYNVRSKRGVGHVSGISANEMDATYILYSVKWILSEIIRIKSQLSVSETQKIISELIERKIELIWKKDGLVRILSKDIKITDQILIFLYDKDEISDKTLQEMTEYKNISLFKNLLKKAHKNKFITYDKGICHITPVGIVRAELVIQSTSLKFS